MMEIFVGVIIACLPSLAKLLRDDTRPMLRLTLSRDGPRLSHLKISLVKRKSSTGQVLPMWYGSVQERR